jgi:hypothetical protein
VQCDGKGVALPEVSAAASIEEVVDVLIDMLGDGEQQ